MKPSLYGTASLLAKREGVDLSKALRMAAEQLLALGERNARATEINSQKHQYEVPESLYVICTQITDDLWVAETIDRIGGQAFRCHGATPELAAGPEFRWKLAHRFHELQAETTFELCKRRACKVGIVIADRVKLRDGQRRYGENT